MKNYFNKKDTAQIHVFSLQTTNSGRGLVQFISLHKTTTLFMFKQPPKDGAYVNVTPEFTRFLQSEDIPISLINNALSGISALLIILPL
jgi:hypothetical protein